MQSPHFTDGKTEAQREEGDHPRSHSRLAIEHPGQVPLPTPGCLFSWQCTYSHSELPVEITWVGSFLERKGRLQGHTLPCLKGRSLGIEDSVGALPTQVTVTRMHCKPLAVAVTSEREEP